MTARTLAIVIAGSMLAAIAAGQGTDKTDQDTIQGSWVLVGAESGGKKAPDEELKKDRVEMVFTGDRVKIVNERKKEEGTFQLDAAKTPKEIDFTPDGDKVHKGIYQLKGNTLRVCMSHPPQERPTEFVSKEGDPWPRVFVFQRKKAGEQKRTSKDEGGEVAVKAGDKKSDEDKFVGTWTVVSAVKQGKPAPEELISKFTVSFDKAGNMLFTDGDKKMELTYKLDAARSPKEIDLTEDDKGVHKGIYLLEGDSLKICTAHPPLGRPTEFASPEGQNIGLIVLKRAKK
jgi:uncharacterized protein (TIGR03067 family)